MILFENKNKCCGCGACMNICPKKAISMKEDEYGFTYPEIDKDKCIECGACKRACGYQNNPSRNEPRKSLAGAWKDVEKLKRSASGGIFAGFATSILTDGGVVYGASMENEGKLTPKHIRVEKLDELYKLQGSKYVQSAINDTYSLAKKDLMDGKMVLFSGTPCQIAGFRAYLNKDYDNLLTTDIICHGVPSTKLYQDYIDCLEKGLNGKITKYFFRDKFRGQGYNIKLIYSQDGIEKTKYINGKTQSYISYFSRSCTFRDNCYSCPFANKERVSDVTIGDFWGFYEEFGNIKNAFLDDEKGVSCILINTKKGEEYMDRYKEAFELLSIEYEKIARHNEQLNHPGKKSAKRTEILEIYRKNGYDKLNKYYSQTNKKEIIKQTIIYMIPKSIKRTVKILKSKVR